MTEHSTEPVYRRAILKLSGESFCREREGGISMNEVARISRQIKSVVESGTQLAIVCGGGNILRGKQFAAVSAAIHASTAHYMGMLATVINALALQDALEDEGVPTRVQSAIRMEGVAEPFIRRRCVRHLEKGRVVILAAGTGSPFVTTDTAAALRARELEADVLMKATKVDGVFSEDPEKNPHAVRYSSISFQDVLKQNLQVMDAQAIHHCMEHGIPILVFNYQNEGNILRAIQGERIGTIVQQSVTKEV
jgi:uridylate kinase